MKNHISLFAAVAIFAATASAKADGTTPLLTSLAKGTINNIIGNELSNIASGLGIFSWIGLGSGTDPVLLAKLNEIINDLQVMQTDIDLLDAEVTALATNLQNDTNLVILSGMLSDMQDASNAVKLCVVNMNQVAGAPGSDANDAQMHDFALQIIGREAGPCNLSTEFATIHSRIVTDQAIASLEPGGFYTLLAQVACVEGYDFEPVAAHFIEYQIRQREILELIRNAYSSLGEVDNLTQVFTEEPLNYQAAMKDEEIALLQAADAFVICRAPPYGTDNMNDSAALADEIVQKLENVPSALTTYSLSFLPTAQGFTPTLAAPSGAPAPLQDVLTGQTTSYYDSNVTMSEAVAATCLSGMDGFSWAYPSEFGFTIGSGCNLAIARHLMNAPPAGIDASWQLHMRDGNVAAPSAISFNAANMTPESASANLSLGGDSAGRGSGFSEFNIAHFHDNPLEIEIAIDLPGNPGAVIGAGTTNAFVALTAPSVFTLLPFGAPYLDRYYLIANGEYLSVGDDGFAAMSATPFEFDFVTLPDGNTELDYPGGVLYVDVQYQHYFYAESPDDAWVNAVDLSSGTDRIYEWEGAPVSRPSQYTALYVFPPCDDDTGLFVPEVNSPHTPLDNSDYYANCSDHDDADYERLSMSVSNNDIFDRQFQLTLASGAHQGTPPPPNPLSDWGAGMHCFVTDASGTDTLISALDTPVTEDGQTSPDTVVTPVVAAGSSIIINCQILDQSQGYPSAWQINKFVVQPCKTPPGESCVVF